MYDIWREILYPLGFLSALFFGVRTVLQWLVSEIKQESIVTRFFWQLSMAGNICLMLHSLVQQQFHVCVVQACNAVISWRNLNVMDNPQNQAPLASVIKLLAIAIIGTILAFLLQNYFFLGSNIS